LLCFFLKDFYCDYFLICLVFYIKSPYYPCAEYMVEKLGIDEDGVVELNQILYKKYGTSMAGLKVNYNYLHKIYVDQTQ